MNGANVTLIYDEVDLIWTGITDICGKLTTVTLNGDTTWNIYLSDGCAGTVSASSVVCLPVDLKFTNLAIDGCCTDTIDIEITA